MYLYRCTLTSLPHISETLDNAAARGIRFIRLRCFVRLNSRRDLEIVTNQIFHREKIVLHEL